MGKRATRKPHYERVDHEGEWHLSIERGGGENFSVRLIRTDGTDSESHDFEVSPRTVQMVLSNTLGSVLSWHVDAYRHQAAGDCSVCGNQRLVYVRKPHRSDLVAESCPACRGRFDNPPPPPFPTYPLVASGNDEPQEPGDG